ncbi:MAG: phosphate/phosphite/phosphonate ABC transporter substrate-binding protein [Magnetococcales bacterium]|nr:phosphate/phosphite/phosphonate ABC transporter substrate-binding protein [Magnetococcales bacterium]
MEYVAARLGADGIAKGEVRLAKDLGQLVEWVRAGEVDWVTGTPYTVLQLNRQAGTRWLARRWKNGVTEYRTCFITRKEGAVRTLDDLRGGRIVMESADSTSGFMMPMAMLLRHPLEMVHLEGWSDPVPSGKTGYWLSGSAHATAARVAAGDVEAGAVSDQDWRNDNELPELIRKKLRVFHQTGTYPRAIEVTRPGLPAPLREHLLEILRHAHENPAGERILRAFDNTTRFDSIPEQTLQELEQADGVMRRVKGYGAP